jgi:hypothetical protein
MSDDDQDSQGTSGNTSSSKSKGRAKSSISAFGRSLSQQGQDMMSSARDSMSEAAQRSAARSSSMPSMKRGGVVRKTGPHFLHRNERVVPAGKRGKRRGRRSGRD